MSVCDEAKFLLPVLPAVDSAKLFHTLLLMYSAELFVFSKLTAVG